MSRVILTSTLVILRMFALFLPGETLRNRVYGYINQNSLTFIDSLFNCRDLGGYKISGGTTTKFKKLLRSGATSFLNNNDIKKIKKYGVKMVIDLLEKREVLRYPSVFSEDEDITYHNVPLSFCDTDCDGNRIDTSIAYINILENQKKRV